MLTWIIVALIVIVAAGAGFVASRPNSFRVARTAQIGAPPEKVFALINDFHEWPKWSPWEKLDPAMTRTHSGTAAGPGAAYAWTGNKKVGEGRMEITATKPARHITIKLEFLRPWKASNVTEFALTPKASGTEVTWAMSGASNFMFKLMGLFMNMDQMIGKDFEAGLAAMKAEAEK